MLTTVKQTTVRDEQGSNGNGRPKTADGSYPSNTSPVHLFEVPVA